MPVGSDDFPPRPAPAASDQELSKQLAVAFMNASDFAELLARVLALAAMTHPELLRRALADVFDLRVWEQQAKTIRLSVERMQSVVNRCGARLHYLEDQVERIEKELTKP